MRKLHSLLHTNVCFLQSDFVCANYKFCDMIGQQKRMQRLFRWPITMPDFGLRFALREKFLVIENGLNFQLNSSQSMP